MTIPKFIEKAIEGGWKAKEGDEKNALTAFNNFKKQGDEGWAEITFRTIVLEPKAWEAVGKVEGWDKLMSSIPNTNGTYDVEPIIEWKFYFYRLPVALVEGKTLEEFIETL